MSKFKVGDKVVLDMDAYINKNGDANIAVARRIGPGVKTVTMTGVGFGNIAVDGYDNNGWGIREDRFKAAPLTFKSGDRVKYTGTFCPQSGATATVYEDSDGRVVRVKWDDPAHLDGAYDIAAFELVPKTRGDIIVELRKRAGLPPFMVGDVVNYKTKDRTAWQGITIHEVLDTKFPYRAKDNTLGSEVAGCVGAFTASQLELVTPAPSASLAKTYKFKVGDCVRLPDGNTGEIAVIDFEDDHHPYLVNYIGGEYDGEWCDEAELEFWIPKVGDRVAWLWDANDAGTVVEIPDGDTVAVIKFDGETDTSWMDFDELLPSAIPAPVIFSRGDIVEIVGDSWLDPATKSGDLAIVEDNHEPYALIIANDNGFSNDIAYAENLKHAA